MNVLITGGAGFIGSHLAASLLESGERVTVIDDLSTGALANIQSLMDHPHFRFVQDTVRNDVTMTNLADRCDAIYHLAAAVGVKLIAEAPVHTIETNIHGSEVVLAMANRFRRPILVASTSEVYGKSDRVPFREDDDVTFGSTRFSRWCYGCSKMVDEFLALAYHNQFGLPAVVCRFFNVIGPRQTGQYGMVVPRFVRRALRGQPLEIVGDGKQVRCFCNVGELVEILPKLLAAEKAVGRIVNLGSDEPVTMLQLARRVLELTGSDSELRYVSYEEFYGREMEDTAVRIPDLTRLEGLIGLKPTCPLDQTLREIIDFEKSQL